MFCANISYTLNRHSKYETTEREQTGTLSAVPACFSIKTKWHLHSEPAPSGPECSGDLRISGGEKGKIGKIKIGR